MTAALRRSAEGDREFPFSRENFRTIVGLLRADSGIHLDDAKMALVYSRLAKRLRALGLPGFDAYCGLLGGPEGVGERQALLSALTTNVTRFFREPHHFEALRALMRDDLAPAARAGARVRLWSAGCSLGHEPYSMALCVQAELPEAADLDVRILATDIDPQVVARARQGDYGVEEIAAAPADLARQGFVPAGDRVRVSEPVRRLVRFGVLNLNGDWPMRGGFDVIFCRNVAIYFDEPTQRRLWARLAERLTPDGRLCIGHSERIEDPGLITDGLTLYRRRPA